MEQKCSTCGKPATQECGPQEWGYCSESMCATCRECLYHSRLNSEKIAFLTGQPCKQNAGQAWTVQGKIKD